MTAWSGVAEAYRVSCGRLCAGTVDRLLADAADGPLLDVGCGTGVGRVGRRRLRRRRGGRTAGAAAGAGARLRAVDRRAGRPGGRGGADALTVTELRWTWDVTADDLWAGVSGGVAGPGRRFLAQSPGVRRAATAAFRTAAEQHPARRDGGVLRLDAVAAYVLGA